MFKKVFLTFLAVALCVPLLTNAQGLNKKLAGKMLLQVEDKGRIWYVSPESYNRMEVTFANALPLFEGEALGITNTDLSKIPVDPEGYSLSDDSDDDGFTNRQEIAGGFNPFGEGRLSTDIAFGKKLSGKLLLQVEDKGRIWYVDFDGERWEITWNNLMNVFEKLSLGITNDNLGKIPSRALAAVGPTICTEYSCLNALLERCVPGQVFMEYKSVPYIFFPMLAYEQSASVTIFGKTDKGCKADFFLQGDARNLHELPMTPEERTIAMGNRTEADVEKFKTFFQENVAGLNEEYASVSNLCEGSAAAFASTYDYDTFAKTGSFEIDISCDGTTCTSAGESFTCRAIQRWNGETP